MSKFILILKDVKVTENFVNKNSILLDFIFSKYALIIGTSRYLKKFNIIRNLSIAILYIVPSAFVFLNLFLGNKFVDNHEKSYIKLLKSFSFVHLCSRYFSVRNSKLLYGVILCLLKEQKNLFNLNIVYPRSLPLINYRNRNYPLRERHIPGLYCHNIDHLLISVYKAPWYLRRRMF